MHGATTKAIGPTFKVPAVQEDSASTLKGLLGSLDPRRWDRKVVPKRLLRNTVIRCVKPQKFAELIHTAAEA